jgi:ABC-type multidrug transport system ATPase subunit
MNNIAEDQGQNQFLESESGVRMKLDHVDIYRGTTKTFSADRIDISANSLTAVVGISGSGKTTVLECLSGNLRPQTGQVFVDDQPLSENLQKHQSELAYIPQEDIVHSEVTVLQAVRFAALIRLGDEALTDQKHDEIRSLLRRLGIYDVRHQRVGNLSGGQRKRVSTATELVSSPRLLLLDEPTAGLDPANHRSFMHLLRELADDGCTVVFTTHNTERLELCDRIVLLGDGTVEDQATPEKLLQKRHCDSFPELFEQVSTSTEPEEKSDEPGWSAVAESLLAAVQPLYLIVKGILFWSFVLVRDFLRVLYVAARASLTRPLQSVGFALRHLLPRQFGLLRREQIVLFQHPAFMGYLFILPAIIGVLIGTVSNIHTSPSRTVFLSLVASFWLGITTSSLSIIREFPIVEKERMASPYQETYVVAYLSSKLVWYGLIGLTVGLLLLGGLFLTGSIHYASPEYSFRLLMTIGLIELSALIGVVIGLLVSTISENQVFAMALIPLIVLPGILLSRVALNKMPHEPVGTPEMQQQVETTQDKKPFRIPSPDDELLPDVWYWAYRIHPISFLYDGAPLTFRPQPDHRQEQRYAYLRNTMTYTLLPSLVLSFVVYFLTHLILLFRGRLGIGRFLGEF